MTQIIAHRGASKVEPENTLAAFLRAVEMGADAVELDVRRTADGALVVHHDAVTTDGKVIAQSSRRDLPATIPDFGEALAACAGVAVNVEIKVPQVTSPSGGDSVETGNDGGLDAGRDLLVDDTMAVLWEMGGGPRWIVSSFDVAAVARVVRSHPRVRTALVTDEIMPGIIDVALAAGCWGVNPADRSTTRPFVQSAHLAGLAVNVWTVDDPDRIEVLLGWGVDGIFTNVPDAALTLRERRA